MDVNSLSNPKKLKTLVSTVKYSRYNSILHEFVLQNSEPNPSNSESYINAVLLSMSDVDVNAINIDGYTALHLAVLKKNYLMVKKMIFCLPNIDVNQSDFNGKTALYLAVGLGHSSIVQEMLNNGANLNVDNVYSTVCFAATSGDLDTVKILIDKVATLNVAKDYLSPLYHAVQSGHLSIVEFLLSKGADRDNEYGWGLLRVATRSAHLHVMKFFLDRVPNGDIDRLLFDAVSSNRLEILKFLLEKGANVTVRDNCGRTLLHRALDTSIKLTATKLFGRKVTDLVAVHRTGKRNLIYSSLHKKYFEILEFLKNEEADLYSRDEHDKISLQATVSREDVEILTFLIEQGANVHAVNEYGQTPLHSAVFQKNLEHVKLLLSKGVLVNAKCIRGKTPLHQAVCHYSSECAELLISKGAYVNVVDEYGRTPLHNAVDSASEVCTELLIERGANVNVRDTLNGSTPLHYALNSFIKYDGKHQEGLFKSIKLLLNKNADVNVKDNKGESPLSLAMRPENDCFVRFFLQKAGDDVNVQNDYGETLLFVAVWSNNLYYTRLLLEKGADVNLPDGNGWTPLHAAVFRNHSNIVRVLLETGADKNIRNKDGKTPGDLGEDKRNELCVNILSRHKVFE